MPSKVPTLSLSPLGGARGAVFTQALSRFMRNNSDSFTYATAATALSQASKNLVLIDISASATITVPADAVEGDEVQAILVSATTNNVAATISGISEKLYIQGDWILIRYDGSSWQMEADGRSEGLVVVDTFVNSTIGTAAIRYFRVAGANGMETSIADPEAGRLCGSAGRVANLTLRASGGPPGDTDVRTYFNEGAANETISNTMAAADTNYSFDFTELSTFSAGDVIHVSADPAVDPVDWLGSLLILLEP